MRYTETPLKGSYLINLEPREDERGFFARYFCAKEFSQMGLNTQWVQINNSFSKDIATLRGLHFQKPPHAEVKLIRCISGAIWDVIVDLREGSASFGQWFGAELTAENRTMLYVPEGFAHGFITLNENTEIIYLVSNFYAPEAEQTLLWSDQLVNIGWPIKPSIISEKDTKASLLQEIQPLKITS